MRVTQSVAVGLVSLLCTVNASRATAKPVLAKSQVGQQVTVSQNGCTAVCMDNQDEFWASSCEVYCDQTSSTKMPATSTYTSTLRSTVTSTVTSKAKATLTKPSVVSANTGACHETCSVNEAEGDIDCSFSCDADFSTAMPVALHQRTVVSAVQDDCTAVCWDLMPGTECDVQCSSDFKTAMPVGFAAPSKAARIANLPARENVQALRVHEARLARKFGGVVARDGNGIRTVTSTLWGPTLTSTITLPTIMPLQLPQTAETPAPSALLSLASAVLSEAQQDLPTFSSESTVNSKVDSLLSAMFATSHTSATATPVPTSSALKTLTTTTAISTALETTTASATSSKTTTALATVSETTTALVISSKTTTAAATSPKTTTTLTIVSETTTEVVTSSKTTTVAATSPKTTTTAATESETTTASLTSSKTTTKSVTVSKTTTKSATASKTTTKSTTASETVTSSTTSSETTTTSNTSTASASATLVSFSLTDAASGYTVPTGLVLSILVGLTANAVFLI